MLTALESKSEQAATRHVIILEFLVFNKYKKIRSVHFRSSVEC